MTHKDGQAGAVEITLEMIEAGVEAYIELRPGEASDFMEREIVTEIYRRMVQVQNEFDQ